jgi:hypothetical protein
MGIGVAEPGMIGFTLSEIWHLLTKLVLLVADAADHVWSWPCFRQRGAITEALDLTLSRAVKIKIC